MARSRCLPGGLDAVADDACAEGVKSEGAHEVQWPPPAGVVEKEVEGGGEGGGGGGGAEGG